MRAHVLRDVTLDRARPLCQVIDKKRKPKIFEKITKTVVISPFLRPYTTIGQRWHNLGVSVRVLGVFCRAKRA
jgi:hypothetical protein